MRYLADVNGVFFLIEANSGMQADKRIVNALGRPYSQATLNDFLIGWERLTMIYATPFNKNTKKATGESVPLGVNTLEQAAALIPGEPIIKTKNTYIYEQVGDSRLCLSWIQFKVKDND